MRLNCSMRRATEEAEAETFRFKQGLRRCGKHVSYVGQRCVGKDVWVVRFFAVFLFDLSLISQNVRIRKSLRNTSFSLFVTIGLFGAADRTPPEAGSGSGVRLRV